MNLDLNNYEEWMVAFLDDELNPEELTFFNEFIKKHPELKNELVDFASVRLAAEETIVFENKKDLYKGSGLFFLKKVWPIAAAIVLLLALIPFIKNETQNKSLVTTTQAPAIVSSPTKTQPIPTTVIEPKEKQNNTQPTKAASRIVQQKVKASSTPIKKMTPSAPINQPVLHKRIPETLQPEIIVQQNKRSAHPETNQPTSQDFDPPVEKEIAQAPKEIEVQKNIPERHGWSILKIDEENNAVLHQKLNEVVAQVEDKIEQIKELKSAHITVSIGNKRIFSINN